MQLLDKTFSRTLRGEVVDIICGVIVYGSKLLGKLGRENLREMVQGNVIQAFGELQKLMIG